MNPSFKLIIEKALLTPNTPKLETALDDIYVKLLVLPIQKAWLYKRYTCIGCGDKNIRWSRDICIESCLDCLYITEVRI